MKPTRSVSAGDLEAARDSIEPSHATQIVGADLRLDTLTDRIDVATERGEPIGIEPDGFGGHGLGWARVALLHDIVCITIDDEVQR